MTDVNQILVAEAPKLFISKTHFQRFEHFRCPLQMGFWHYSPHGCCLFVNEANQSIHHLYLRESCSLTVDGQTLQSLLSQAIRRENIYNTVEPLGEDCNGDDDDDDAIVYDDYVSNNRSINARIQNTNKHMGGGDFLNVLVQPYMNEATVIDSVDQRVLSNVGEEARKKLLHFQNEIIQQFWFVVCDLNIELSPEQMRNKSRALVENLVLRRIFGPIAFCVSAKHLSKFFATVTNRFIDEQMPIINNMPADRLMRKIKENIKFVAQFPAQNMLKTMPGGTLFFMDARDIFDVVKQGYSSYLTLMRPIHLANEASFLDTWRRIIFNFIQELVNIHKFDASQIRIRSTCSVMSFIKGNNRTVLPEFRCDTDQNKCTFLRARRREYEIMTARTISSMDIINNTATQNAEVATKTLSLSEDGAICRHVLEVMVDEYGEAAVDEKFKFNCFFNNNVFEHENVKQWERVVRESTGHDGHLHLREHSTVARERLACMQILCGQRRMNDIHRFCLPKRFLTMFWFRWACQSLQLNTFEGDDTITTTTTGLTSAVG